MHGNVETGAVEGLEHDFGGVLAILWRIERLWGCQHDRMPVCNHTYGFCKEKVVVFRLDPEVFEDGVGPEPLHVVPVLHLSMSDRVTNTISRVVAGYQGFVADEEIKIFCAPLRRDVGALSAAGEI